MRHFASSLLVALSLLSIGGASAESQEQKAASPLVLEAIEVVPAKPAPDTLCRLRVKVRNTGTQAASRLALSVRINGKKVPGYDGLLLLQPLVPGASADVPLYNFWSTETYRPVPKGKKLSVEVELRKAEWVDLGTPAGDVPGLPVSRSLTVAMGRGKAKMAPAGKPAEPKPAGSAAFTEVTAEAGIDFVHQKAVFDQRLAKINSWMASINAGIAAADYDNDGDVDYYLLNSLAGHPNALYRNEGNFHFVDVAAASGLADANDDDGVSMDAVFGDLDNDGDQDLYVASYGRHRLYRNQDGFFTEVARESGIVQKSNAAVAHLLDFDNDGWLDVMVGNYFDNHDLWNITTTKVLQTTFEYARNGGPNLLYRNLGKGMFTEVAKPLHVDDTGWALDIGAGDVDNDGDTDVYLANDYGPDVVYRNNGNATFTDVTDEATGGDNSAGMNVDFGDLDNDGDLDIYVTNITNPIMRQGNMHWINEGELVFVNAAREVGTSNGGWGWAAKLFDFDHDGDLDIYTVNGFVSAGKIDIMRGPGTLNKGDVSDISAWPDMRGFSMSGYETNRFFRNDGATFPEVAAQLGVDSKRDGRGIALGDVEGDGDLDMFVSNCGQAPELFRNDVGSSRPWLQVELAGTVKNRDAIGARVTATSKGRRQIREVDGGNGFSSQSTRVVHFGFADGEKVEELEIRWPGGKRQVFRDLPLRTKLVVVE